MVGWCNIVQFPCRYGIAIFLRLIWRGLYVKSIIPCLPSTPPGYLPFEDTSVLGLFERIKTGHYTFPSNIPSVAASLISGHLLLDPFARLTMKEVRNHAWLAEAIVASPRGKYAVKSASEPVQARSATPASEPSGSIFECIVCWSQSEEPITDEAVDDETLPG